MANLFTNTINKHSSCAWLFVKRFYTFSSILCEIGSMKLAIKIFLRDGLHRADKWNKQNPSRFLPLLLIFRIQTKITRLSVTHKLFHSNISRFRCTKLQNNLFSTMQESTVIITNCSSTAELFGRLKKRKISYISFSYSLQSIARIIIYSRTILRKSNTLHFVP